MFEIFKKRKRSQASPTAAPPDAGDPQASESPTSEPSTDAEDFHVPPAEVFQEEEQDGQGTSPRLRGE
jgi:hypothetical protein